MNNKSMFAAIIGGLFIVLAVAGSLVTSRQMNKTADQNAMSSGRSGDSSPNLIQEQQVDKTARGPSSTGNNPNSNVPPASR